MRGPVYAGLSRALGAAVVQGTIAPLCEAIARRRAVPDDIGLAVGVHGVAGHLVALPDIDALGDDLRDLITREACQIARRAERLTDDIRALGRAAADAGLPFTPLKGSWLRSERYRSPALRPSSDVDLLVGDEDLGAWRRVLADRGYTREIKAGRHWVFSRPDESPMAVAGEHAEHPRPVELHTRITDRVFGADVDVTDAFRADLRAGQVMATVPAVVPGEAGLALHLFLHASAAMLDRGMRLAQLLDFAFVAGDAPTRAVVRERLGDASWAVVHLLSRDVPGLLAPAWLDDGDVEPPTGLRQRVILSRPGLLRGDPYRLSTLGGELLLAQSPLAVIDRVRRSWRDRRAHA